MILSAAQLLGWYGQRKQLPAFKAAEQAIEAAAVDAIAAGEATRDVGGRLGTAATGKAFVQRLLGT